MKNSDLEGLGVLTEIAAEVATGAIEVFDSNQFYAGSTLVRQLVEIEYFMWRFASDPSASSRWLKATPTEIRDQFSPKTLRKMSAGVFDDMEYWHHCDFGGHPNPKARILLINHSDPFGTKRIVWVDLAQHLKRLWGWFTRSLSQHSVVEEKLSSLAQNVSDAMNEWHFRDPLSAGPSRFQDDPTA